MTDDCWVPATSNVASVSYVPTVMTSFVVPFLFQSVPFSVRIDEPCVFD